MGCGPPWVAATRCTVWEMRFERHRVGVGMTPIWIFGKKDFVHVSKRFCVRFWVVPGENVVASLNLCKWKYHRKRRKDLPTFISRLLPWSITSH